MPLLQRQFPEITDFYLPPEGCSYRLAVVSMRKQYAGHAKRVMFGIWSFLRQFMYTKIIIVTDDDIDIRDWKEVIWALTTRADPARDSLMVPNTPIDYLDFASPVAGLGGKLGIVATNKWPGESARGWGRPIVMDAARRHGVAILPVDSEHNAIHQCLQGRNVREITRLILTASGGPFRGRTSSQLQSVTAEEALQHPTWRMGRKITVDSATLMNKGLEVIEAHWLFGVRADQIDVVVHPQSVIHSMVELVDGSVIAQLGVTDMRLPIQYAFSYPERWSAPLPSLDLVRAGRLEFHVPDTDAFPCLRLAYRALDAERSLPVVLNAANEVAVARFLDGRIGFPAIAQVIEQTMAAHRPVEVATLSSVRQVDAWAREHASEAAREVELKV